MRLSGDTEFGAPLCARCGHTLLPQAAFCGQCGLRVPPPIPPRLTAAAHPSDSAAAPPSDRPLRTGELALMEFLCVIPFLNIILLLTWMFRPHPQRARIAQAKLLTASILLAVLVLTGTVMALLFHWGILERLPFPTLSW